MADLGMDRSGARRARPENCGRSPSNRLAAAKIVSRGETLASRVFFLERTCPGHEPGTMPRFARRRPPLSEIWSRDDATLARSDASITEPLWLVNVGPFLKAFGTAIFQGNIHLC